MRTVGLLALLLVGACGFPQPSDVAFDANGAAGPPAQIQVTAGTGQSGPAGSVLASPFVATVQDANGIPVPDVAVDFVVTVGDGSVAAASAATSGQGQAQTTLTLGTTAGDNVVEVRVAGLSPVTFTATGLLGAATQLILTSGNNQTGIGGSALAAPLVVTAKDAVGNPIADITVGFVVTTGGGSVATASVVSNAQGEAQTTMTLGPPGMNTVDARVAGLAAVVFTATGVAGPATQIFVTSGNSQTGVAGSPLTAPLVVTVKDAIGNPVAGTTVDFVVTGGGGSISTATGVTDGQGRAQTSLTLGTIAGTNTVEARVAGLTAGAFAATGIAGPATQVVLASGDGQTGIAGSVLAAPLIVTVEDVNGNPVAGTTVAFVVITGGGSVSQANLATDAQGRASTSLTLGTTVGTNTVEARATGLSGSPIGFGATGVVGPASRIVLTSGNHQSAKVGATLASPVVVTVSDANANPVAGIPVGFVVTAGGGSVTAGSAATDAQGRAQTAWTVGASGANTLEARASALTGSPVVFSAVATGFAATVDFPTGSSPSALAVGDLNGDGKLDLAVANSNAATVSILLNTAATGVATPSFAAKVDFPVGSGIGTNPEAVAIGDLNGDGRPDLVVVNAGIATASVLLNTTATGATTPSFATKVDFTTGSGARSVAIGDLNGDGRPELAFANYQENSVSVLRNATATGASTPSFAYKVDFATWFGPTSVAIGDFNGDALPDLVVTNLGPTSYPVTSVLLNTTTIGATLLTFATRVNFQAPQTSRSVAIGDVNGDGKPDLALASYSSAVSVLLNTTVTGATTPSVAAPVSFATGSGSIAVAIGDVNGDGKVDLASANSIANTVSVVLNTTTIGASTASFAANIDFPTGVTPTAVAIGDLNGDGKPDLAVVNRTSNTVSVLLAQ